MHTHGACVTVFYPAAEFRQTRTDVRSVTSLVEGAREEEEKKRENFFFRKEYSFIVGKMFLLTCVWTDVPSGSRSLVIAMAVRNMHACLGIACRASIRVYILRELGFNAVQSWHTRTYYVLCTFVRTSTYVWTFKSNYSKKLRVISHSQVYVAVVIAHIYFVSVSHPANMTRDPL